MQATQAALYTLDLRVRGHRTNRYHLGHRTLFPIIRAARGQYLLTSHAGTPLVCWDRRRMGTPLHTQESLVTPAAWRAAWEQPPSQHEVFETPAYTAESAQGALADGPSCAHGMCAVGSCMRPRCIPAHLEAPKRPPCGQALWLECNEDLLLGRSLNGGLNVRCWFHGGYLQEQMLPLHITVVVGVVRGVVC